MNNTQMTARVGLFFVIGAALTWVTFESLGGNGALRKDDGYTLIAPFASLKELKTGDDVRMAGVRIGSVTETRLTDTAAVAILTIDPKIKIANTSTATIAMAGLLGGNYVSLELAPLAPGTYTPGDTVRTKNAADLNQIMTDLGSLGSELKVALGGFSESLSGHGADGQGNLFQKLDRLVSENSAKINATMANLEAITAKIRAGEGTIGKLVNDPSAFDNLNSTLVEIKAAAAEAKTFVANTQAIIDQVKSGQGPLGTLVYDEATASNLKLTVANLRTLSEKLNDPNSTFGQLITNDTLIKDAQATLRKVDRAVEGLGDTGPITAVGATAGALF